MTYKVHARIMGKSQAESFETALEAYTAAKQLEGRGAHALTIEFNGETLSVQAFYQALSTGKVV